jgi:putative alpha-1,2-mannosidase
MDGQHAYVIIVDAYIKGLRGFNVTSAYDLMYKCATGPCVIGRDFKSWEKYGYIPYDNDNKGSCTTQALAYDDFCLGIIRV